MQNLCDSSYWGVAAAAHKLADRQYVRVLPVLGAFLALAGRHNIIGVAVGLSNHGRILRDDHYFATTAACREFGDRTTGKHYALLIHIKGTGSVIAKTIRIEEEEDGGCRVSS